MYVCMSPPITIFFIVLLWEKKKENPRNWLFSRGLRHSHPTPPHCHRHIAECTMQWKCFFFFFFFSFFFLCVFFSFWSHPKFPVFDLSNSRPTHSLFLSFSVLNQPIDKEHNEQRVGWVPPHFYSCVWGSGWSVRKKKSLQREYWNVCFFLVQPRVFTGFFLIMVP